MSVSFLMYNMISDIKLLDLIITLIWDRGTRKQ